MHRRYRAQLLGSSRLVVALALPFATQACARGNGDRPSVQADASVAEPDADSPSVDAAVQVTTDAPPDAGCAIAQGLTPTLDGDGDLAQYPAAQHITPGAMLGTDAGALAWDRTHLYVTISSNAFAAPYEPLHIYVEAGGSFAAASSGSGKEYGGLTPALPFAPTHVIAVRRVSDSGTGAYNGVFVPGDGWMTRTFALDAATFASSDHRTLSVQVPWTALGECPTTLRLAMHVVHGQVANEWKDLVPSTHTPWQSPGGGYYEIDLTGALAVSAWTLR